MSSFHIYLFFFYNSEREKIEKDFRSTIVLNVECFKHNQFTKEGLVEYIKSLNLLPPEALAQKFEIHNDFPCIFPEAIDAALNGLLERQQPDGLICRDKDSQPMLVTVAPTGSGKVCERQSV